MTSFNVICCLELLGTKQGILMKHCITEIWLRRSRAPLCNMIMSLLLSACTVQPLYSSVPLVAKYENSADLQDQLASVSVESGYDVVSQLMRNKLVFLLGGEELARERYKLRLGLSSQTLSDVSVTTLDQTDRTGRPSAGIVRITSNFVLSDQAGNIVLSGTRSVAASFDRPQQEFANLRAEKDARKRASEELAEQVFLAIATGLAQKRPVSGARPN